jgi:hypothetical protein
MKSVNKKENSVTEFENMSNKELDKLIWREQCKIWLIQSKINKLKTIMLERNESK